MMESLIVPPVEDQVWLSIPFPTRLVFIAYLGSRSKQRPLTSEAMCQIATGQLTRFMFEWMGMKRVPGYLHDLIIHRANPSSAQLRGNGSGPLTVETMLATPRDVARQVRYLSHYACLHIASWAVLLEYFLDIRTLDVKYGRYGRLKERASLMCQARALLDQMQQKLFRDLFRLVSLLPEWRPYVRIVKVIIFSQVCDCLLM